MFDQSTCFGKFHHDDRHKDESQSDQIQFCREQDQTERYGQRCKQNQHYHENGDQCRTVQFGVSEHSDFEKGMLGAHIVRLYDLGK